MRPDAVAKVTGSSRGIGAATARLLGESGYHVCVNYRSNESAAIKGVLSHFRVRSFSTSNE